MKEFLILLSVIAFLPLASSSAGERTTPFTICFGECMLAHCKNQVKNRTTPMYLQYLGWNCIDECKYDCMQEVTATRITQNKTVQQYFGKWPIIRILGMQEPAAVLFSAGNGLGHYLGWKRYTSIVSTDYTMHNTWKWYSYICMNAWFWSVVFHIRDIDMTEKLDYFSAASMILFALYCFFVRILGPKRKFSSNTIGVIFLCLYACHVYYLGFVKFDYGYNMKANVTVGVIYTVSWLLWCVVNVRRRRYVWKCALLVIAGSASAVLELFDFPPLWGHLDAHALWHLTTIPLCYYWYSFLVDDALYEIDNEPKKEE